MILQHRSVTKIPPLAGYYYLVQCQSTDFLTEQRCNTIIHILFLLLGFLLHFKINFYVIVCYSYIHM